MRKPNSYIVLFDIPPPPPTPKGGDSLTDSSELPKIHISSLRFSRNDRTVEVIKLFIIWLTV